MKKLFLLTLVGLAVLTSTVLYAVNIEPDFEAVWSKGYVDGYCYDVEFCIEPIAPIAPLPRLQDTTYTIIYNRGFLAGRKASE